MSAVGTTRWRLARAVSSTIDLLRAPIKREVILLVRGKSSQAKFDEVLSRLTYITSYVDNAPPIKFSERASLVDLLRSSVVASSHSSAIRSVFYKIMRWVIDFDYERNPLDGWYLFRAANAIDGKPQIATNCAAKSVFEKHLELLKLRGDIPVYIFGTGPSLQSAVSRTFSDGFRVVCNTIVKDQILWHHLKPDILCAGDAIYHFGANKHAKAFRADALERLKESGGSTIFVYPASYDLVVRSEFREVKEILVPIREGGHKDFDHDLSTRFLLPSLGNVLNHLLLPVGMTLSKDVRLWGFDGRAPDDAGFWSNSENHSYPELVPFIHEAHPAFFSHMTPRGHESQYVKKVHGDDLENRLTAAESHGYKFSMLHRSWTPTLQKRFGIISEF